MRNLHLRLKNCSDLPPQESLWAHHVHPISLALLMSLLLQVFFLNPGTLSRRLDPTPRRRPLMHCTRMRCEIRNRKAEFNCSSNSPLFFFLSLLSLSFLLTYNTNLARNWSCFCTETSFQQGGFRPFEAGGINRKKTFSFFCRLHSQ